MKKVFNNYEDYQENLSNVYKFFQDCYETILSYLKDNGDIELGEEELYQWKFDFLAIEGTKQIVAIRLGKEKWDFYLEDEEGLKIYWEDINHDLIITEMLMDKVFGN